MQLPMTSNRWYRDVVLLNYHVIHRVLRATPQTSPGNHIP